MQTVYHAHTPDAAGMILAVKKLIEVKNVLACAVRTAQQAPRGFVVEGRVTVTGYVRRLITIGVGHLSRAYHRG